MMVQSVTVLLGVTYDLQISAFTPKDTANNRKYRLAYH